MAHYAELNENNEVIYVAYMDNEIITDENGNEIEQLGIDHLHTHHGSDRRWVRASYRGNFRGKYPVLGEIYLNDLDIFISKQPHPSWTVDLELNIWVAPLPLPELTEEEVLEGFYYEWDENLYQSDNTQGWILKQNII